MAGLGTPSPPVVTGPPVGSPGMVLGDLPRRFLAQLLDTLWLAPLAFVLALLGQALRGGEDLSPGADILLNVVLGLIVLQFWAARQATPGKWVLGLRIVAAEDGGPVPFPRLVLRYLGYLVASLPLGLGFLWAAFDARAQGWHDKMARTLVVRDLPPGAAPPGAPGGPPVVRFG